MRFPLRRSMNYFLFLTKSSNWNIFDQILTKDSVTVFVNAIMYYKVRDATLAVSRVDDYGGSSRLLSATTLRNVLGTKVTELFKLCCHSSLTKYLSFGLE